MYPHAARSRLITLLNRDARRLEARFRGTITNEFKQLGAAAVSAWRGVGGSVVTGMPAPKALSDRDLHMVQGMLRELKLAEWHVEHLTAAYKAHYQLVAVRTIAALGTLGIVIDSPDAISTQILELGGTRAGLVNVEAQTEKAIYRALAEGRDAGLGPVELERHIRALVEGGPNRRVSYRATRIARTETLHAQRMSALATYEGSEVFATVIAFDNLTGADDADCTERDGTEYTYAEADTEAAAEHPNGTLGFAPGRLAGDRLPPEGF